mgnify:FL=1
MDEGFQQKLSTVFHELWHISPKFDGDLRRHRGRCYIHTYSEAAYDEHVQQLASRWLNRRPPVTVYDFLKRDFDEVEREYQGVIGIRIPQPKLIPLDR